MVGGKKEQWFTAYDEATGDPYYYTASGAVSWDRPDDGGVLRARHNSLDSAGSVQSLKAKSTPLKPAKPKQERKVSALGAMLRGANAKPKTPPPKPAKPVKLLVTYAFKASNSDELSLKKGNVVTGIRLEPGNEWWYGFDKKGKYGIFPCAFVEKVTEGPAVPKPPVERPSMPSPIRSFRAKSAKLIGGSSNNVQSDRPPLNPTLSFSSARNQANQSYIKAASLQFTLFAHNLGYASAFFLMFMGLAGVRWSNILKGNPRADQVEFIYIPDWVPYYAMGMSVVVFFIEFFYGLHRSAKATFPLRSIFYLAASIPTFTSFCTALAGFCMVCTSFANMKAFSRSEDGVAKSASYISTKLNVSSWTFSQLAVVVVLLAVNGVLWAEALFRWISVVKSLPGCDPNISANCPSDFAPFAKAFGQTLNFNCAIILFPVLKTLVARAASNGGIGRSLDIGKSVELHKLIAILIGIGTLGHFFFHLINFAERPQATVNQFGYIAFVTGAIVFCVMVVMFAGAQKRVKHANFEIFWYSHHLFVVFFAFLLAHGPVFYKWGALSLILYLGELTLRRGRAKKPFLLHTVHWSPPVMCLRFFPQQKNTFSFKEGQYLRLMIPHISVNEWHPFTMSSAFGDLDRDGNISLHIRVMEPGSWTFRAKEYFRLLSGSVMPKGGKSDKEKGYFLELKHFDNNGSPQLGKHLGPDGLPLISVDGPHPAPAQHFDEYEEVLLIGAGIGMTPCAAIMQSVLRYKWKKGFNPQTIRFYWVLKHEEIESFRWFIKLLTKMQRQVIADRLANALTGHHELEINIYVTSAPTNKRTTNLVRGSIVDQDTGNGGLSQNAIEAGYDVDIGFSDKTLTLALLNTEVPASQQVKLQQASVMGSNEAAPGNKLKDIWVWNGRPEWDSIFESITEQTAPGARKSAGVVFCGTPVIGNALKVQCRKHTNPDKVSFNLHKEKF